MIDKKNGCEQWQHFEDEENYTGPEWGVIIKTVVGGFLIFCLLAILTGVVINLLNIY